MKPKTTKPETRNPATYFLAGPTGVGKTALALALAERLDAEIVGADAFQVYAGLPVLTAQPSTEERRRVPHHLIGDIPPTESFDAHRYVGLATSLLADLRARNRVALVVGGTGLYFRGLIDGFAPTPPPNAALRDELEPLALPALLERLRRADPAAPPQIDGQNPRRVRRAIEIVEGSGRPLAEFRRTPSANAPGLLVTRDREDLRRRIQVNVQSMFSHGVVEEVRTLGDGIGPTAARAIGWREIQALLRGELSAPACEAAMVTATRQYAKRQLTWFRHQTKFTLLDLTDTQHPSEAADRALSLLDATCRLR